MSAWADRWAKVFPNNEKLVKIIAERGQYFRVHGEPRVLKVLGNKVGLTLVDKDGYKFTTESRNARLLQDDRLR